MRIRIPPEFITSYGRSEERDVVVNCDRAIIQMADKNGALHDFAIAPTKNGLEVHVDGQLTVYPTAANMVVLTSEGY